MIKFLRAYYYALLPVMFPLVLACISYITGNGGNLTKERIIIFTIGGIIISCFGYLVEIITAKTKLNRVTVIGITSINILFWGMLILIAYTFNWENIPFNTKDGTYYPSMWIGHFFNAMVFYINALFLFPYYQQKKIGTSRYLLLAIGLILGTAFLESFVDLQLAEYLGLLPVLEEMYSSFSSVNFVLFDWTLQHVFIHTFYYFISFVLIFPLQYLNYQHTKEELEKERIQTELKFLKAQINPHFLFNGINSVYHLIDLKPEIAKSTLLNFSNLLRYQLYECNDDLIPLEKELNHIRDYVAMEKIRRGEDVNIQLELPEAVDLVKIPPLLFTPFIENAFKYVSNHDDGAQNKINLKIRLQEDNGKLRFEVENTIDENPIKSGGGIGIENVKKRLNLIFPKQHDLDILKANNRFIVRMSLNLEV